MLLWVGGIYLLPSVLKPYAMRVVPLVDASSTCAVCLNSLEDADSKALALCPNGHPFCRECLRLVYAHRFPRMLTCPLCRTVIDPCVLDPKRAAERAPTGGAMLTLRIGNSHAIDETARSRKHQWEVFVDVVGFTLSATVEGNFADFLQPESLISEILFSHRSFRPRHLVVSESEENATGQPRYMIRGRSTWEFEVAIFIQFHGPGRLAFRHELSFDGDGSDTLQEHRVAIRPELIAAAQREILLGAAGTAEAAAAPAGHQRRRARPRSSSSRARAASTARQQVRPASAAATRPAHTRQVGRHPALALTAPP